VFGATDKSNCTRNEVTTNTKAYLRRQVVRYCRNSKSVLSKISVSTDFYRVDNQASLRQDYEVSFSLASMDIDII